MNRNTGPTPRPPGGQPSRPVAPKGRANTLGLNSHELETIFNQLDGGSAGASHKRQSARLAYRQDGIGIEIVQPGGGQTQINVACRNLSRTGLGFLHSSYVHIGTSVVVTLSHTGDKPVRVPAKVVRCRHVTRHIHDVGVKFDEAINVRDFMERDPLNQTFTCEVVDPKSLKGAVLIVAEYHIEQQCVTSMLKETALEFICASTVQEGLDLALKGVGLVICDDVFEKASGVDFVLEARKAGVRCPVILMSADSTPAGLARIRKADADAFLAKPLQQDLLLRAVAEFLLVQGDSVETNGPILTSLPPTSPMAELADSFVDDIHSVADQIEQLAAKKDAPGVRRHCQRIAAPAASLGFVPIAKIATTLMASLDATQCVEKSVVPLNAFVTACRSTRKGVKLDAKEAEKPAEPAADAKHAPAKEPAEHEPAKKAA